SGPGDHGILRPSIWSRGRRFGLGCGGPILSGSLATSPARRGVVVHRGEIWWADLSEPRRSEPAHRRPVLIVQDDLLTASALHTVMIVPLTSNLLRARAIGNVLLHARDTGLDRASVALVCQVTTLDKAFVSELVGSLPARARRAVDAGLRLA